MKKIILLVLLYHVYVTSYAQRFNQDFESATLRYLLVANINGDIHISGDDTQTISVRTRQEYKDKINGDLPEVDYLIRGDTLALFIKSNHYKFSLNSSVNGQNNHWGYYDWNQSGKNTILDVDFEITLPYQLNLILSTINDGDITVIKSGGDIWTNNINGNINLEDIKKISCAKTINGDVQIRSDITPKHAAEFYTLNGDIKAFYPQNLNANISFKSFQGDFYTNFSDVEVSPNKAEIEKGEKGIKYKIGGKSEIKINQGGVHLDFETFNGNVYIRTI